MLTVISTFNLIIKQFFFNLICLVVCMREHLSDVRVHVRVCMSVCVLETICGDLWTGLVGGASKGERA